MILVSLSRLPLRIARRDHEGQTSRFCNGGFEREHEFDQITGPANRKSLIVVGHPRAKGSLDLTPVDRFQFLQEIGRASFRHRSTVRTRIASAGALWSKVHNLREIREQIPTKPGFGHIVARRPRQSGWLSVEHLHARSLRACSDATFAFAGMAGRHGPSIFASRPRPARPI